MRIASSAANRSGFTWIEMMAVIAINGLLTDLGVTAFKGEATTTAPPGWRPMITKLVGGTDAHIAAMAFSLAIL